MIHKLSFGGIKSPAGETNSIKTFKKVFKKKFVKMLDKLIYSMI